MKKLLSLTALSLALSISAVHAADAPAAAAAPAAAPAAWGTAIIKVFGLGAGIAGDSLKSALKRGPR